MTENEAKRFMMIEKECINRDCNRDCVKCDIVQTVDNLNNAYDMAIKALEEIQQYRAIGTPEECREAMEKQKRKLVKNPYGTSYIWKAGYCPVCGCGVTARWDYCQGCGQKLSWSDYERED